MLSKRIADGKQNKEGEKEEELNKTRNDKDELDIWMKNIHTSLSIRQIRSKQKKGKTRSQTERKLRGENSNNK